MDWGYGLSTRLQTVIHPTNLKTPKDEDLFDWELSNKTWFHDMEDKNDAAICSSEDDNKNMKAGEKITLEELFDASAGLNIIVDRSAWTLGEQSLEDETTLFESLTKPKIDSALPLPKRRRVSTAGEEGTGEQVIRRHNEEGIRGADRDGSRERR